MSEAFSAPEWALGDTAEVTWRSSDAGFSRIHQTVLMTGNAGSGRWRWGVTRRGSSKQTAKVPMQPGSHVMFQVVSEDGARNRSYSRVLTTRVPFDQTSTERSAGFSGAWMEAEDDTAFGGTVHTSTAPLDSFSFTGTGNSYCLLYDWETEVGSATFDVGDETRPISADSNSPLPMTPDCFDFTEVSERLATLTVHAGRLRVDGFWSGRIGAWTKAGRPKGHEHEVPRSTRESPASLTRLLDVARVRR